MMTKITAIHSGGDWYDASAEYIILPAGADIQMLYADYYRCQNRKRITFHDWLLDHGGRCASEDELEVFDEDNEYCERRGSEHSR